MGRPRKNLSNEPVSTESETNTEPEIQPVEVVDLEEAEQVAANPEIADQGKRFFIGQIGVIKLKDNQIFHVRKNHNFVTDKKVIDQLLELSQNPANQIFPQD